MAICNAPRLTDDDPVPTWAQAHRMFSMDRRRQSSQRDRGASAEVVVLDDDSEAW